MTAEFEYLAPEQKYDEPSYLTMMIGLLPRGIIWGVDRLLYSEIVQDIIASSDIWQDINSGTDVIQDVETALGDSDGSLLGRWLSCFGSELWRVEAKCWELMRELTPGLAEDLLTEWEEMLGLPEDCYGSAPTLAERQRAAHAKFVDTYKTTTNQFFIDYAATLGFVVTVVGVPASATPRIMGVARMGAERMTANKSGNSILEITVISGTGNLAQMQCIFNKIKQAHVIIVWK